MASLGAVTAGAAVAGVGTFGSFTDSTTPVGVAVDDGVVSIDLAAPDRLGTVPLTFDGVVPGWSVARTVRPATDGDSEVGSILLSAVARTSSVLDTDAAKRIADDRAFLHGPVDTRRALRRWAAHGARGRPGRPGRADHLALAVSLAESAGNEFAEQSSALEFTFTAVQRAGTAR